MAIAAGFCLSVVALREIDYLLLVGCLLPLPVMLLGASTSFGSIGRVITGSVGTVLIVASAVAYVRFIGHQKLEPAQIVMVFSVMLFAGAGLLGGVRRTSQAPDEGSETGSRAQDHWMTLIFIAYLSAVVLGVALWATVESEAAIRTQATGWVESAYKTTVDSCKNGALKGAKGYCKNTLEQRDQMVTLVGSNLHSFIGIASGITAALSAIICAISGSILFGRQSKTGWGAPKFRDVHIHWSVLWILTFGLLLVMSGQDRFSSDVVIIVGSTLAVASATVITIQGMALVSWFLRKKSTGIGLRIFFWGCCFLAMAVSIPMLAGAGLIDILRQPRRQQTPIDRMSAHN